jgi:hypothetical protein
MLNALHPLRKTPFLRNWIIATTLGLIAGTLASWYTARLALSAAQGLETALAVIIPNQGIGQVILALPTYLVKTTSVGTVVAIVVGISQWWVIHRRFVWAREWLAASVTGAVASYLFMAGLNILAILLDPANGLLKGLADSGLWLGTIMGAAQWRVLRKHSRQALWWMVASIGIWGAGSTFTHLFGQQVAHVIGSSLAIVFRNGLGMRDLGGVKFFTIGQVVMWSLRGLISGFVTGKVWVWLVKQPLPERQVF